MKQHSYLTLFLLTLLVSACTFEVSKTKQDNKSSIERNELIGEWTQINNENSFLDSDFQIKSIHFNNDSTANIVINDSIGNSRIIGKWKYGFNKKIKNSIIDIQVQSDIELTFNLRENKFYKLLFIVTEEGNKLVMTSFKNRFEKK